MAAMKSGRNEARNGLSRSCHERGHDVEAGSWRVKTLMKAYLSVLEMVAADIFPDEL
jgi:hypothetical protein